MYAPGKQDEPERQLNNNMDELAEFSKLNNNVDFAGRIIWKEMKDKDGNTLTDAMVIHVCMKSLTSANTKDGE